VSSLPLGLGLALGASASYAFGVTFQALEARAAPADECFHLTLLRRLATRPRWIVGTLCVVGGWGLQAAALMFVPMTVVQPSLAVGLFLLLAAGVRYSKERIFRRDVLCVLAIAAGVTGLALTAPGEVKGHGSTLAISLGLSGLGVVAILPYVVPAARRREGVLVAIGAGLAYAWTGFSTKFAADAFTSGAWLAVVIWVGATAAAALFGLLNEMTALQARPATRVFPVVLVVQIVVAVVLAPVLAGQSVGGEAALTIPLAVLSLAIVASGAGLLARAPAVGAAVATES
jgi:hypothetical protein